VGEDDQLAQQAEREHLHAEDDQQGAQQQRRSVCELLVEEQSLHREHRDDRRPMLNVAAPTMPKKRSGRFVNRTRKKMLNRSST
jgi:hypothetical protein